MIRLTRRSMLTGLAVAGICLAAAIPSLALGGKARTHAVTLTFWSWVPHLQDEVSLFNKSHADIQVKLVNVGQGATEYQKLRTALKAGSGAPDVPSLPQGPLRPVRNQGTDHVGRLRGGRGQAAQGEPEDLPDELRRERRRLDQRPALAGGFAALRRQRHDGEDQGRRRGRAEGRQLLGPARQERRRIARSRLHEPVVHGPEQRHLRE